MKTFRTLAIVAACTSAAPAIARELDASKPTTPTPALRYDSAFSDYRPYADVEVGAWKDANDALAPKPRPVAPPGTPQMNLPGGGATPPTGPNPPHPGHSSGGGR